jgi:hypothetical protein
MSDVYKEFCEFGSVVVGKSHFFRDETRGKRSIQRMIITENTPPF